MRVPRPGHASAIRADYSLLVTADTGLLVLLLTSVELSVLVTVLTAPVTDDSGVLAVELATVEPTVLTAEVTGARALPDALVGLLVPDSVLVSDEIGLEPLLRADVGLEAELPASVELSVLVTVLTLPVTDDSGVLEVELATVEPTVLTAEVTGARALVGLLPLEPVTVLVIAETGLDEEPVLAIELKALVGLEVDPPVSAELSVLVTVLTLPVTDDSGVLEVELASVEPTVLTAEVTGDSALVAELGEPPAIVELSVLVTVLTLPVTDDSGVLEVEALSAEPTVLTAEVTGDSAPAAELGEPPAIVELSVLVTVLTLPVTDDSGVLEVDALSVEPAVLTAEVTVESPPPPAEALLSDELSVLVAVLTVLPTVDSGVLAVELEVVLPTELTLEVTGASGLVEPPEALFEVAPLDELLVELALELPPELLLDAEEPPLLAGEISVPPPQPPSASSASTPMAIADLLKRSIESSLSVSGARDSGRAVLPIERRDDSWVHWAPQISPAAAKDGSRCVFPHPWPDISLAAAPEKPRKRYQCTDLRVNQNADFLNKFK